MAATAAHRRGVAGPASAICGALALLGAVAVAAPQASKPVAALAGLVIALAVWHPVLLAWRSLIALMIFVIIFVPVQRYVLPVSLPFQLDLFRLVVAVVLVGWIASLLVDPSVRFRRTGVGGPFILIVVSIVASMAVNNARVVARGADASKHLTYFLSYLVIVVLIVGVTRAEREIDFILKVLVGSGSVVAGSAIFESRTHYNVFDHLSSFLPVLRQVYVDNGQSDMSRGYRVFASSQHPIALSAAFVLLVPVAVYLVQRTRQRRWWLAAGLLLIGTAATISRTSVIMLLAVGIVFIWLRPREMKRLWPALAPALVLVHLALPGTLGTLKQSFFPSGGLVAQQTSQVGSSGQGRLADLGPAFDQLSGDPLFGAGYSTHAVGASGFDGQILDDQWLGTLVETGALGAFAWLWLLLGLLRRLRRAAALDRSPEGWLLTSLTASIAAFGAGMFFFDAFAFIQVTVIFFLLVAIACVLLKRDAHTDGRQVDGMRAIQE